MPSRFKKIVKHFDAFGQPVSLMYKGSTLYRTFFGGSLTIVLTIIVLALSFQSMTRLFNREKIFTWTSTFSSVDPIELEIPFQEGFYLALGYNPDGLNNLTHRPFDILVEQKKYRRDPNGTRYLSREKKFVLEPCEAKHFPKDYDYIKAGHKNWLCFPRNSTITLKGQFESDEFEYIKISINKCINSSLNNSTCMDQAQFLNIAKQLREGTFYFKLAISSHLFNLANFGEPYFQYMETSTFFLVDPSNSYKSADIFIKHNTVITDYDLLYDNPETRILPSFLNYREQTAGPSGDTYAAIFLRCALERSAHHGAAEKFSVILANFGGLLTTIFALFHLLLKFFNTKRLMLSLSNLLYHFEFDEREPITNLDSKTDNQTVPQNQLFTQDDQAHGSHLKKHLPDSLKNIDNLEVSIKNPLEEKIDPHAIESRRGNFEGNSNEKSQELRNANDNSNNYSRVLNKDSFLKNIQNYLGRFKKLKIRTLSIIVSLICCKRNLTKEGRLARKAYKKIGRDMDIVQLLYKVKEVEKLKNFLLDHRQKVLFEFFPKKVVRLEPAKAKSHKLDRKSLYSLSKVKKKIYSDFLRKLATKHLSYVQTGPISVYLELFDEYRYLTKQEEESKETKKLISMLGKDIVRILNTSSL